MTWPRSHGNQVADYEEYTHLFYESWLDPEVRWLLSTVPSCMIFDDHDVIDDWNTSAAWLADMRATDWWQERLLSGLMSYWSTSSWATSPRTNWPASTRCTRPCARRPTAPTRCDSSPPGADADPAAVRWSYRRDFGRIRLLMVDSPRGPRPGGGPPTTMLDPGEAAWLREQVLDGRGEGGEGRGAYDHLLIGTSLPWLLPHLVHDVEAWNAAMCGGERGARWARLGNGCGAAPTWSARAAFPSSFDALGDLIAEAGSGPGAPATVSVLSGDVHHAYVAEPSWPGRAPDARVAQLTCSPVHNSVPLSIRLGFRFGWSARRVPWGGASPGTDAARPRRSGSGAGRAGPGSATRS
ncbi:Alkaline phosphatase family protein OS=Streptomyces microflavus OX=1919 GN=HUT09_09275 PE=4 SV=1 [Streptomyces microflavus]